MCTNHLGTENGSVSEVVSEIVNKFDLNIKSVKPWIPYVQWIEWLTANGYTVLLHSDNIDHFMKLEIFGDLLPN